MTERMKALTLTQPWASLVACGAKRIETRTWAPPAALIGERIAIHAAKGWTEDARFIATTEPFKSALREGYQRGLIERSSILDLPRGCVVAIATLMACYAMRGDGDDGWRTIQRLLIEQPHERAFGGYGAGRYAWVLRNVRAIEPIRARGALGLWDWQPPDWLTYVDAATRLAARAVATATADAATRNARGIREEYERSECDGAGTAR